ncbi:MAG: lysylphosphatidylglycerol synthase domain-containing protein, partial [Gemmatimonadales bacterium]
MSLLAAASLVVLDALIRAVRIRTLTAHPASLSLSRAVVANAFGDAASALTPARLGGEPMRFVWLTRAGVSGGTAMVALAAERVIDLSLVI